MLSRPDLDTNSDIPLYRQLARHISGLIVAGTLGRGDRLPATRELASQLGLNRTTISAAYEILEKDGLVEGHVGRGSFVSLDPAGTNSSAGKVVSIKPDLDPARSGLNWDSFLPRAEQPSRTLPSTVDISFASSSPAQDLFPLAEFRKITEEVIGSPEIEDILQLGSSMGYPPLRRYLSEQAAAGGWLRPTDDILITNGCQQGLDLLARTFASSGRPVLLEDPVYHGQARAFGQAGMAVVPVPVNDQGLHLGALEQAIIRHNPCLLVVTPTFQNPTGITQSASARLALLDIVRRYRVPLVENDMYTELRYQGESPERLKKLDDSGDVILLGSYSKVSFPGLRVGWVVAPRPVISRLTAAKQTSDLHSDQLAQAVMLRFAESGHLAEHLRQTCIAGAERLRTALRACTRFLPSGSKYTHPEGGMSLWIELPAPLTAQEVLTKCLANGVAFLPGANFSPTNPYSGDRMHVGGLRISFGGLTPTEIERGLKIVGETATELLASSSSSMISEPACALV